MGNLIQRVVRKGKRVLGLERTYHDDRIALLKKMPRGAVCAEIGVWQGDFSAHILAVTQPKMLHLIDPWEFQPEFAETKYGGVAAKSDGDMTSIYDQVQQRFAGHTNVAFLKDKSTEALERFEDNSLDWVYIDGNHYYDFVLGDLRLSLAKVKSGGYITGDDYEWGEADGFPVKKAVATFVQENNLSDHLEIIRSQFIITVP